MNFYISIAGPITYKNAGHLVDVRWLAKNLTNPGLLLLDASPAPLYTAQHIPGAVSVDLLSYGAQEKPAAEMERLYQSWGVSPGKTIVLYDQGGTFMATRVFFSLYYHGFPVKSLFILDGGLAKWQEASLPVSKDLPAPRKGTFTIKAANEDVRVRLPEFLAGSGDPAHHVLLEALGPDWHFGQVQPFGKGGHPPNSVLLPSADFFKPDKTFKSPDELKRMLAYLKIRPEQNIYSYCGGGVAASAPFFALKFILAYPKVKLYVESEMGYVSDERDLPYWTYDAPFLLRSAAWLQVWGSGQMMRTYVDSTVSIVDVRPADAFDAGHTPFALNIPADAFKANLRSPAKLAALLGAAGVDASHEAVVVSGAGLTKDAALAIVLLEKLGQKKVSVLTDSLERWAQLGFAVTKAPTVIGPKKGPRDPSIPPTTYPGTERLGVIIDDPKGPDGLYPKVFIASGKDLPSTAPEGKVVHVPYTDLLNPDGTPKAAKDIWTILSKAGVPRYAELVCVSDDPGEASANYFVLKLMGYPDVKVLFKG
jgi:3-mercaptopyruvate sulfurtransferase SseA